MICIVDSGSTKCDWLSVDASGQQIFEKVRTPGMNPAILNEARLFEILEMAGPLASEREKVSHLYFYGAGCGTAKPRAMLKKVLETFFNKAEVHVKEDTYAAVYATVGRAHKPAVVCILGTGSNCSYFDGNALHQRVDSLGYSIMDDASGNYFGRQLLRAYYFNQMPEALAKAFSAAFDLNSDTIKAHLYKQSNPNAYLASFAQFMFEHKHMPFVKQMIKTGIRLFAQNMILQFKDVLDEVPVHFAGSVAYFSKAEILEVGEELGFTVGNFERRPAECLVAYHLET